jgi:hypothetical protein
MMKKLMGLVLLIGLMGLILFGCSGMDDSDSTQRNQQEKILKEATKQTGMPNVTHFFEKKMLKKVIELRDNPQLTTYAYTQNMDGRFVYLGRCIGFGIPYSTQYTNPEKIDGNSSSYVTIPQADPNGLFSPSSTSATWLMLVNEDTNESEIIYAEPNTVVTQTKLPKRLVAEWSLSKDY